MHPPKPRPPLSRLSSEIASDPSAVLEDDFQFCTDLKGPLSTIPGGAQNKLNSTEETVNSILWDDYFETFKDIRSDRRNATFRVYIAGNTGPVLFCLHGGGYTGLSWALVAAEMRLSCIVVAMDMRGHGETVAADNTNLASEVLSEDVIAVWRSLFEDQMPATVLIGHSMGGAIAIRAAASQEISSLAGLVVIDVVEGTALAALPHMQTVLANRPPSFPTLTAALAWARHSGMFKNMEAAAVSLPSQLKQEAAVDQQRWVWRTALAQTAPFWDGWYRGLSQRFLSVKAPKILMLAGTDRLDKELTIGQMQGKFQMVLLPQEKKSLTCLQAGHAVHEDEPLKTVEVLQGFLSRYRISNPVER